jgi:hypothetical protein
LLGLDTEAYTTGQPFMVCMSDGTEFAPEEMPGALLDRYPGEDISVYNLKYDSGALLYHMPTECKIELWIKNVTHWGPVKVEYIPHKCLTFTRKKDRIRIWDVSQYFSMSLDKAAHKYLGTGKADMETKRFTVAFVKKHRERIKTYCVQDAKLCADLGTFLVGKLSEFGIRSTALYSSASLSFRYFADRSRVVTAWRYWKHYPGLMKAAIDSYEGGKFEVTGRGSFEGYEYDLVSAYPCEIARLADITFAEVVNTREYVPEALYAFLRCRIVNPGGVHIPCGIMLRNVRVYPVGEFYITVTKAEYDYMRECGLHVDILEGFWLKVPSVKHPYAATVAELFKLKSAYKGKDAMLYEVSKRMLNSYYGKMVQCIENWKSQVVAGPGFNPMYASIITANTRIKMCRIQNALGPKCLAVHTDSVITTEPLAPEVVTDELGAFGFVEQGPGLIVACGQYALGSKEAYKGFAPRGNDCWRTLLERHATEDHFSYPVLRVESWVEATAKGHFDKVNYFEDCTKLIDLNGDTKRTWLRTVKGRDLLGPVEQSEHRAHVENNPPEYWP